MEHEDYSAQYAARERRRRGGSPAVRGHPFFPRGASVQPCFRGTPGKRLEWPRRPPFPKRLTVSAAVLLSSRDGHLCSSSSRVCQKEPGRLGNRTEACGVTGRGGAMRSARGRGWGCTCQALVTSGLRQVLRPWEARGRAKGLLSEGGSDWKTGEGPC